MRERRKTKEVKIGGLAIGGTHEIAIQSMLNVPSLDIAGNVEQAKRLEEAGCQIIRLAVPEMGAVKTVEAIKNAVSIPLVADIHFDYRLALESAAAGVDKIRINPGNIGEDSRVKQVADTCRQKGIPIRIGVNSGSVERHILAKYGRPSAEAMVESALYHVRLLEKFDFEDIVISIKSSNVSEMIDAYRLIAKQCDYPLHLGVTEAGTERMGLIKSAVGLGSLLVDGIGDTIRVSLTADPVSVFQGGRTGFLPNLWTDEGGFDYLGQQGGRTPTRSGQAYQSCCNGLCRQRTGRGKGSGHWHCWWKWGRNFV